MSGMNFLEKLLDGGAVEWKPLAEVAIIGTGSRNTNEAVLEGKYPFFVRSQEPRAINEYEFDETAIITAGDGVGVGKVFHFISGKYALHQRAYRIVITTGDVIPKFLFHFIRFNFSQYLATTSVHASVTSLRKPMFEKYPVPVPPLKVQAEIVRMLDTFTELTAELNASLTAELSDRQKQYNYYRDQLFLRLEDNEEKLGDIADICLGLTYTPTYVDSGVKFISAQNTSKDFLDLSNVKYISEDEYRKSTSNAKPKRGDLLFTRVGSNLGHPVIVDTDEPLCMFVSLGFIRVNPNKVLNSYIKHWMNTDLFWDQVRKNTYGAAKINLNTGWLNKFDVLLPSLHEQARIVAILDKFDALTTSISEGLPREIALRQKQYEYYRDLLLTFPKP